MLFSYQLLIQSAHIKTQSQAILSYKLSANILLFNLIIVGNFQSYVKNNTHAHTHGAGMYTNVGSRYAGLHIHKSLLLFLSGGFLSKTKTMNYKQVIEVKNTHSHDIKIQVEDQLPRSNDDKIKVRQIHCFITHYLILYPTNSIILCLFDIFVCNLPAGFFCVIALLHSSLHQQPVFYHTNHLYSSSLAACCQLKHHYMYWSVCLL